MAVTEVFTGHACQCCAGVIANGDESGCRDYYGHDHRSASLEERETRQLNEIHNVALTSDEWTRRAVVTEDETSTYVDCDFCEQTMGYHDGHEVVILWEGFPSMSAFTLSETAQRIGLTLTEVREARKVALILNGGRKVTMPKYCPPSLATEAARMALGGPVHFSHLSGGYPVYELDD